MQSVILTELGIAVFDEGKCVKTFAFSDPATDFKAVKKGQKKIFDLIDYLAKIDRRVMTSDEALLALLKKNSIDSQLMEENEIEQIQVTKPKVLVDAGFANNEGEAMSKLRDFALNLSSSTVTETSQSPDLHIIQSINSLDEIDKIINGISSRLREWYGLHFPELDNIIDSINGYSQIVLAGRRGDLTEKIFEDAGFPESKIEMLSLVKDKSRGGDISDENLSIVQGLAKQILDMHDLRKKLEDHIETQMSSIAPNLSAILGTSVGARILARAGSLRKLAAMPSSTIQVIGAEKALFRSLKTGSQPPKHGLLFQHSLVHAAPRWQRGKIARAVAAKAAIASRVDFHSPELNETLLEKLNVRVDEIGEKYKNPVERPQSFDRPKRRDDRFQSRDRKREGRGQSRGDGKRKKSKKMKDKRKKFGKRR